MRTQLALALLLLLTFAATAPLASALCVPRHEKKSESEKHDSEDAAEAPSASEKASESKRHKSSEDDDDAAPSAAEKKSESKKRASEDDAAAPSGAEKKSKSKSDASEDDHDEKRSENKSHASEDDAEAEKKTKSKNDASEDDDGAEKKSKSKSQASEDDDGAEKKSKSKSHASKDDAAPSAAETTGTESVLSKKVGSKAKEDKPDGEAAPKKPAVTVQSISDMITKPVLGVLSPVIKTLCTKTDYPDLCESSIAKLPEAPPALLDGVGVLKLAMNAVRAKIVEAKNAAVDKMTDPGTDKLSKAAINDCLELYDDMNTNFDTAEDALKRGDKGTAGTMLDSALTDVDTCENGFLDRDGLKPLMADDDKILAQLSSNVLAINAAVD